MRRKQQQIHQFNPVPCLHCGRLTESRAEFKPRSRAYEKSRYIYALCDICIDNLTIEMLDCIEESIYYSEQGNGRQDA